MDRKGSKGMSKRIMKKRRNNPRMARRLVRMKVKKLQKLIPGGRGLKLDRLFLRTADYILHLRVQVNLLQALSKIYSSP